MDIPINGCYLEKIAKLFKQNCMAFVMLRENACVAILHIKACYIEGPPTIAHVATKNKVAPIKGNRYLASAVGLNCYLSF